MCARIFVLRPDDGASRKPTVSFTPLGPQYFVTTTAIASGVGLKRGLTNASRARAGKLAGLVVAAVSAAATHCARGRAFGVQTIGSAMARSFMRCGAPYPE